MFNIGTLIKQHLLTESAITNLVNSKIYNVVVVAPENSPIQPPYLVIEINSLNPVYTKEYFNYSELGFSVIALAAKYNDLIAISEAVKASLEFKLIEDNIKTIDSIEFNNYSERFDVTNELYQAVLQFNSKVINK